MMHLMQNTASIESLAKPLIVWNSVQLQLLQERLEAQLQHWSDDWLGEQRITSVQVAEDVCSVHDHAPKTIRWSLPSVKAEFAEAKVLAGLGVALFGELHVHGEAHTPIANATVLAAWMDWQDRLESLFTMPLSLHASIDTEGAQAHWDGNLRAEFVWCGIAWWLHLPCCTIHAFLLACGGLPATSGQGTQTSPLISLAQAIAPQKIGLYAELHPVTITLKELESLAIDDLVVLPHELNHPLMVLDSMSQPLCEAWLGQHAGHIALELIANPAAIRS